VPIETINTAPQLHRLLTALNSGTCHWEQLTQEAWETRKSAHKARVDASNVHRRATRKDKGISRKGKQPSSRELVTDLDNSGDSDEENANGGEH
jgi:hypothetical protein